MDDNPPIFEYGRISPQKARLLNLANRVLPPGGAISIHPFATAAADPAATLLLSGSFGSATLSALAEGFLPAVDPRLADAGVEIPMALKCAALATFLKPLLDNAASLLGSEISLGMADPEKPLFVSDLFVDFTAGPGGAALPLRLGLCDERSLEGILAVLGALPSCHDAALAAGLECEMRFLCGKARVSPLEYRALSEGDVLVASEDYVSYHTLRAELGARGCLFKIMEGGALALESFFATEDSDMADSQNAPAPSGQQGAGQEGALPDFEVRMELGSCLMSAGDISALKQGSVISAGISLDAPVKLRCGSKVFARGRLVDLGGTLGVQIVSMGEG